MPKFLHDVDEDTDAMAIAIPWVFSKNSRARNIEHNTMGECNTILSAYTMHSPIKNFVGFHIWLMNTGPSLLFWVNDA